MAVLTAKIEWRAATANKSPQRMLELLRDFIVTTAGWTLVTDQIGSGTHNAYFVVTKDRATGYSGDNPIIKVEYGDGAGQNWSFRVPQIFMTAYSAWSGTSGTNQTAAQHPWGYVGSNSYNMRYYWYSNTTLAFSPVYDTDFYISVDTTGKFILGTSKVVDWAQADVTYPLGVLNSPIHGVACFERLAGDTSSGTFYGVVSSPMLLNPNWPNSGYAGYLPVPLRWDGMTADNNQCFFNVGTRLGEGWAPLRMVNEQGKHVMLDLQVRRRDQNKIKGKLFGLVQATATALFPHHTIFPSVAAPKYILSKLTIGNHGDQNGMLTSIANIGMETGSTITTLS